MNASGFYKCDAETGEILYAPNAVYAPTFTLLAEDHESYSYPVDGWWWFDDAPSVGPDGVLMPPA